MYTFGGIVAVVIGAVFALWGWAASDILWEAKTNQGGRIGKWYFKGIPKELRNHYKNIFRSF